MCKKIVAYWPLPRPSCQKKKCTCVNNRCIRSKISGATLTVKGLNWVRIVTLAGSRWTSNYYIWRQKVQVSWREDTGMRTMFQQRLGPPSPRLSSPGGWERKAVIARRVGGQYVAVLFSLQLPLTHNPFNKVRGIFFYRTVFGLVCWVLWHINLCRLFNAKSIFM